MPSMRNVTMFLTALFAALMLLASPASASWTHLGGDPLMSSIKGSGQTARNDFVKKSRSAKFKLAMQRAGLNAKQRSAVASAISKGKFQKCGLKYGDKFVRMAYGASGVFVDRNVTFKDPHYKGKPAPAFCLTVVITTKQGNKTIKQTITIKVPFKCVNFAIVSITTKTTETKPEEKPTATPTPVPTQTPTPTVTPTPEQPKTRVTCVFPAHLYKGGNAKVWCEVSGSGNLNVNIVGDSYVSVTGKTRVTYRYDNTPNHPSPCPDGIACFEATARGENVTPAPPFYPTTVFATITATASANGKDGDTPAIGYLRVMADDFG